MDKVGVLGMSINDEGFCRSGKRWRQTDLIDAVKKQKCKVFELPLVGISLVDINIDVSSFVLFLHHCKRVNEVDLKHPIILDDFGQVANGRHRIARAILEGNETIQAYRLKEMPEEYTELNELE